MSRPPRIEVADGIYHVVARGNERKPISERYTWPVLAYCLMTNHYHLLVQTPNANLARGMRELNGVYAQAFNHRHGCDGHLFQGRYKAVLVQADSHLQATVRYIVRNPLRAGMTGCGDEWRWTSHRATSGLAPPDFLAVDTLLSYFHEERRAARKLYLALVHQEHAPPSQARPILDGDTDFIVGHLARIKPSPEHPRDHLVPPVPALEQLLVTPTDAAIADSHKHGYSMRQIATHLDCSVTTIHRRIRNHETTNGTWKT